MKGILCAIVVLGGLMVVMMETAALGVVAKKRSGRTAKRSPQTDRLPVNVMMIPAID